MSTQVYVGTCAFGDDDPHAILKLKLSHGDGSLPAGDGGPTRTAEGNPGFVCVPPAAAAAPAASAAKATVYVAMEEEAGSIRAYSVDGSDPSDLKPLGDPQSSVGRHPCYASVDVSGRWLLVANYSSGSVGVLPIRPDGSLGPATDSKATQGSELIDPSLRDRQEMAHCHSVVPNPAHSRWVAVCDLGVSTVFVYELDAERGSLVGAADDPRHLRLGPGAGCRHCAWSADGAALFVTNELDCTVTVAAFDPQSGDLSEVRTVHPLPEGVEPRRDHHRGNSDVHLHPNGRFLYAAMRSLDPGMVAVYAVGGPDEGRTLDLVQHVPTGGLVPRNFKIVPGAPGQHWLVVGNQETKTVVSFAVDGNTGRLTPAGSVSTAPFKPCNISFWPPR